MRHVNVLKADGFDSQKVSDALINSRPALHSAKVLSEQSENFLVEKFKGDIEKINAYNIDFPIDFKSNSVEVGEERVVNFDPFQQAVITLLTRFD